MNKALRQSNIELLRIVLMLMIITQHVIVHGLGLKGIYLKSYKSDNFIYAELFVNSFVVIGVNVFVFISGYYGIKFKLRTVLSFALQALFYSLGIYLIFTHLVYQQPFNFNKLFFAFFPISKTAWWFLTVYLGLYFLAPILNKGIESVEKKDLRYLLIGLLFFDCFSGFIFGAYPRNGYTIFHFITLYVLAGYIRKYITDIKKPLLIFTLISLGIFVYSAVLFYYGKHVYIWRTFSYNNPLLILSSVMLFFSFKKINIKSKFINAISIGVFGVYLLHDHPITNKILMREINLLKIKYMENGLLFAAIIMAIVLGIFISGSIIELIRRNLTDKLIDKIQAFRSSKQT